MSDLMNDKKMRQLFQQSHRTMPPGLETRLLAIPAAEATALRWRAAALYLLASVSIIVMFGSSLVRAFNLTSYTLGIWSLELIHSARYALYDMIMKQLSPWMEYLPLGFAGALIVITTLSLAVLWGIASQQTNAGLIAPLRR